MGFISRTGWIFFIIVLIASIGIVDYVKNDSLFGLYSFKDGLTINESDVEVYFCPEDDCATNLISEINSAQESIYVSIYSFTDNDIADALILAQNKGVEVKIIFDYLQSFGEYSVDELIIEEGVPIKIRKGSGSMHNKFMVIDEEKVLTGSYNYSLNANTKNDENLVKIINSLLAQKYLSEFNEIWEQSQFPSEFIQDE